jgi:flagellar hook-basal body complex protein FliE
MSKKEQESSNISPSQIQRDQQEAINKTFDQTINNVKKTVNEVQKDISEYTQQVINLQKRAFEVTSDIANDYIESQKEIVDSFNQSIWTPYIENIVNRTSAFPAVFSSSRAEVYSNTFSNTIDNFTTATRVANKAVFANAELINTSLQQARNTVREYSKIGVNAARNIHHTANEFATIGLSAVQSTLPIGRIQ